METVRQRLISCTIALMRNRGVQATGIADILQKSGAARRSIYNQFPSGKMELMVEATRSAGAHMNSALAHVTEGDDPLASLAEFIGYWKASMEKDDFHSGCPIAMAALGSFETPDLASEAATAFSAWRGTLSDQLERSGLSPTAATSLATFTLSAVEGAIIQSIAYRSTDPLDVTREHVAAIIGQQLGGANP